MKKYILLACVSFLISEGKSQESEYSFKENFELTAPSKLIVSSHVGSIDVIPSESSEIEVLYIAKKITKSFQLIKMIFKKREYY